MNRRGAVVAIGNFDGVHRGHQAVLARALELALETGNEAVALTFEPHPRQFFRPGEPLFRLTPAPMKARLITACGIARVVEMRFDATLASRSAQDFASFNLGRDLGAAHVVIGHDFRFGKGRSGDLEFLRKSGTRLGFGVTGMDAVCDGDGEPISSSRIRDALVTGAVDEAASLLGYRFTVGATVSRGRQLGRKLGFPTANLRLDPSCGLRSGIYAVRLRRANGHWHDGVASFGRRPTVEDTGEPLLEVFLFDFTDNLYDEAVTVSLFGFLRPEEKFSGLEQLKAQMCRDEAAARQIMSGVTPLGNLDRIVACGNI